MSQRRARAPSEQWASTSAETLMSCISLRSWMRLLLRNLQAQRERRWGIWSCKPHSPSNIYFLIILIQLRKLMACSINKAPQLCCQNQKFCFPQSPLGSLMWLQSSCRRFTRATEPEEILQIVQLSVKSYGLFIMHLNDISI